MGDRGNFGIIDKDDRSLRPRAKLANGLVHITSEAWVAAVELGYWSPASNGRILSDDRSLAEALHRVDSPLLVLNVGGRTALAVGGELATAADARRAGVVGQIPAVPTESLGDATFRRDYSLRFAYASGAMAAGIASEAIVEEMAKAGMLGVFGSAGLSLERVTAALDRLQKSVEGRTFGINLIHSPQEQHLEQSLVELYLRRGVRLVEASAYLNLTPHVVRYRMTGIHRGVDGRVVAPNRVLAKVSRVEVATKFWSPPPHKMLAELVAAGHLTSEEAALAEATPIAQDITAEADSGGHTDNRPLVTLLPTLLALRDRLQSQYGDQLPLRVGAAGGIATPQSAAAAFAMGASYLLVGSVHQACVESGTSDVVRRMLAEAEQADTAMCPAADMFEMGVKLQVLKRGTMFPMRAAKLYEIYRSYPSMEAIPEAERQSLESSIFRIPLNDVWSQTCDYFRRRDPGQIERAERDPKHKLALVCRWYLGQSSRWANAGDPARRMDYQVWCGPAMGAFNEWTRGTFLANPDQRRVGVVARNLLHGAAVMQRIQIARMFGVPVSADAARITPQPFS